MICEYGCGQKALYPPRKGKTKWSCAEYHNQCLALKKDRGFKISKVLKGKEPWNKGKEGCYSEETLELMREKKIGNKNALGHKFVATEETKRKMSISKLGKTSPMKGRKHTEESRKLIGLASKGIKKGPMSKENRRKLSKINKKSLLYWQVRYSFFCKVEMPRENKIGEIEVRCKLCKKWFVPTYTQLYERIRQLENPEAADGCYFYCSGECKNKCPLFGLKSDFNKESYKPSSQELGHWRSEVFKRQKEMIGFNQCEYCGSRKKLEAHHEKPMKLYPLLALDPDNGIVSCKVCHNSRSHIGECSTGHLSKIIC
jgi:hypothetical protein